MGVLAIVTALTALTAGMVAVVSRVNAGCLSHELTGATRWHDAAGGGDDRPGNGGANGSRWVVHAATSLRCG